MTPANSIPTFLSQYKNDNYIQGWSELWNRADNLPWDKGFPNPALEDTLIQYAPTIGSSTISHKEGNQVPIRRKKALVPGCGRGVDVLLLASFGYDAFGLECSAAALGKCKEEEGKVKEEGRYPVRYDGERFGRGKVVFVQGDFFKDDWLWALGMPGTDAGGCFDLVYDYTFFCALNPSLRPLWALRHSQLLAPPPDGHLICVEFPRLKDPTAAGPPFASTSEAYMEHLSHPGEDIPYDAGGNIIVKSEPSQESSRNGLERIAHWQPPRTHVVGKDERGEVQDRVSIWRRRK